MTSGAQVAANYFVTVGELSAHNTVVASEETREPVQSPLTPLLPYAPFVLVGLLFVIAFGLQVVNRAKNLKNITTALVLAIMVASIPLVLTYINQGTRQTARAGPDEIPREVRVQPDTATFVRIMWHTDAKHIGTVRFGVAPLEPNTARVYVANDQLEVSDHDIRIGGLKKGKTYEFEILSGTTWYNNNGKPIQFTY